MQRLNSVNPEIAQGRTKELLGTVQEAFGMVPNVARVMANSPAVKESFLGFADFGGNRQYISLGNLSETRQAFIFLMDYANSRRIKLWGKARVVDG